MSSRRSCPATAASSIATAISWCSIRRAAGTAARRLCAASPTRSPRRKRSSPRPASPAGWSAPRQPDPRQPDLHGPALRRQEPAAAHQRLLRLRAERRRAPAKSSPPRRTPIARYAPAGVEWTRYAVVWRSTADAAMSFSGRYARPADGSLGRSRGFAHSAAGCWTSSSWTSWVRRSCWPMAWASPSATPKTTVAFPARRATIVLVRTRLGSQPPGPGQFRVHGGRSAAGRFGVGRRWHVDLARRRNR